MNEKVLQHKLQRLYKFLIVLAQNEYWYWDMFIHDVDAFPSRVAENLIMYIYYEHNIHNMYIYYEHDNLSWNILGTDNTLFF